MRFKPCFLALAWALAMPAFAQTTPPEPQPLDAADCKAQEAVLERDMALARSRGQMLRRRELGEQLAALQTRCKALGAPRRAARRASRRLEQEIRTLRAELERAEEQLRSLKSESH
jgi:septal ring factor EnvC (AmiA/AmiB activator)